MDKYEHGGTDARIDFSANINPLGMPEGAYKALSGAIRSCGTYPDPECTVLREKIGQRENIQPEHIICGNGAADLICRKAEKGAVIGSHIFRV